jgi:hypothetical protein
LPYWNNPSSKENKLKNTHEKGRAAENRQSAGDQAGPVSESILPGSTYHLAQRAGDCSRPLTSGQVLQLQRTLGNRVVTALLRKRQAAPPPPAAASPAIQRQVYLGKQSQAKVELTPAAVSWWEKQKGSGDRKVSNMLTDEPKRYFNDKAEMINYAQGKTENMGYLTPENTWIRLPENRLLVLGEDHSSTTLNDVVKATGAKNYLYEPNTEMPADLAGSSKRVRAAISTRKDELNLKAGRKDDKIDHNLEKSMAKVVVGLDGMASKINTAVNKPVTSGTGKKAATGYTRGAAELFYFRLALLISAKAAKHNKNPQPLWTAQQAVLNQSYKQLLDNLPLEQTDFVKAISKDAFTFDQFLESFKTAALMELQHSDKGNEYAGFRTEHTDMQASNERVKEYEKMREFHMVQKIKAGLGSYSLVGMGDVHRGHLETLLGALPKVTVRKLNNASLMDTAHPTFVKEQKDIWHP